MKTAEVMLTTINDVKNFIEKSNKYDFDIVLVSGKYAVNAKSLMGIFSLDLSKKITIEIHSDDKADAFLNDISDFVIK